VDAWAGGGDGGETPVLRGGEMAEEAPHDPPELPSQGAAELSFEGGGTTVEDAGKGVAVLLSLLGGVIALLSCLGGVTRVVLCVAGIELLANGGREESNWYGGADAAGGGTSGVV
jgi:hypothetical protein